MGLSDKIVLINLSNVCSSECTSRPFSPLPLWTQAPCTISSLYNNARTEIFSCVCVFMFLYYFFSWSSRASLSLFLTLPHPTLCKAMDVEYAVETFQARTAHPHITCHWHWNHIPDLWFRQTLLSEKSDLVTKLMLMFQRSITKESKAICMIEVVNKAPSVTLIYFLQLRDFLF